MILELIILYLIFSGAVINIYLFVKFLKAILKNHPKMFQ